MKIAFCRHGETDYNEQGRMTGRTDVSLNATGMRQAEETAASLQPVYDVLFSSSLKRSIETASIINKKLGIPLVVDDSILERDFGSLAGKTWQAISEEVGFDARKADKEQRYDYRAFGGESAEDVRTRLLDFIAKIKLSGYARPLVIL